MSGLLSLFLAYKEKAGLCPTKSDVCARGASDVAANAAVMFRGSAAKRCDAFRLYRAEGTHHLAKPYITPEGHITFRGSGTHRSKNESTLPRAFIFGGDSRARTYDLTDVNRAL